VAQWGLFRRSIDSIVHAEMASQKIPGPIADTEPQQTAKLREVIELLRSGSLKPSDFA
jgi:hypothetical protein